MSSITTAVPSGLITQWCLQEVFDFDCNYNQCANTTLGQAKADFETICCDGDIVDTTQNLYDFANPKKRKNIDLANLVCCRVDGPQAGGIQPINTVATACTEGRPTPLASMAATNTGNAALYLETFSSASFGMTVTGDYIPTMTPTCLWAYTKVGVALRNVTVGAADITTLPPATTVGFGCPLYPTTTSSYEASHSTGENAAAAALSSTGVAISTTSPGGVTSHGEATSTATSSGVSHKISPFTDRTPNTLSSILLAALLCIPLVAVR